MKESLLDPRRDLPSIVGLIVICTFLFGYKVGEPTLFDDDEAKLVESAQEMVILKDPLTPHFNYEPLFHKPPLYTWLTSILFSLFGVSELTARIWVVIFGIGGVILTFLLGKALYKDKVGLLSGGVLSTSILYTLLSRIALVDVVLTFFVTLSILLFYLSYTNPERKIYFLLFCTSMALGTLTKSLLGIILPILIVLMFLAIRLDLGFLKKMPLVKGALLYLTIASPWYLVEWWLHGQRFIKALFGDYMFSIYLTTFQGHEGPFYFYLIVIAVGMFPWSTFLPHGIFKIFKGWARKENLLLLSWVTSVVVFFSLAKTKVVGYILPVFPGLAIIVAKLWDDLTKSSSHKGLFSFGAITVLSLAISLLFYTTRSFVEYTYYTEIIRDILTNLTISSFFLPLGSIVAFTGFIFKRYHLSFISLMVAIALFMVISIQLLTPHTESLFPMRSIILKISSSMRDQKEARITYYKTWLRPTLVFYVNRFLIPHKIEEVRSIGELLLPNKRDKHQFLIIEDKEYRKIKDKTGLRFKLFDKRGDVVVLTPKSVK